MLKLTGAEFVEREDDIIVVGDAALEIAAIFNREARRPLSSGLISPGEMEAMSILGTLVKTVLGDPVVSNEVCFFSIPAEPIDDPEKDVIYHTGVFEKIISECGYKPYSSNEAMAVIYSEAAKENFSGISLSFGSGMTNVALALNAMEGLSFSVARAGDWIDAGAARSVGSTQSRICNKINPGQVRKQKKRKL